MPQATLPIPREREEWREPEVMEEPATRQPAEPEARAGREAMEGPAEPAERAARAELEQSEPPEPSPTPEAW